MWKREPSPFPPISSFQEKREERKVKNSLIICLVVIILVLIGNAITQNHTKQCVKIIDSELSQLEKKVLEKNKDEKEIDKSLKQANKKWDEMQEFLSCYIEHNELEKVETQFYLIKGEINSKLYDDVIPEIEKCIFILKHIEEKNEVSVKNVF